MPEEAGSSSGGRSGAQTVLLLAAVGAGGYFLYKYWYLPSQMRSYFDQQAYAQGLSTPDYLSRIGSQACQAYGAAHGVPQGASYGLCNELGQAAAQVARNLPQILAGVGQGTGTALSAIGTGGGSFISSIGKAATDVTFMPVVEGGKLIKEGTGAIYGGAKTVVSDVASGIKSAANTLNPVNLVKNIFGIGGGINCSTAQQPANAAWCRAQYGMTSAPGSDAWAAAHGQKPVLTGYGSS